MNFEFVYMLKDNEKGGRQRKRWEYNIKKWTGLSFGRSQKAATDRAPWQDIDILSVVLQRFIGQGTDQMR